MTAMLRPNVDTPIDASTPGAAQVFSVGVVACLEDENHVLIQCGAVQLRAVVATHVPGVVEGQSVLLAEPGNAASPPVPALVIAAWPTHGAPVNPPWHFDRSTGTLALAAPHLELAGVNSLQLNCGDTSMRFSRDGAIETRGQSITAAAVETHRIEGGSIELN